MFPSCQAKNKKCTKGSALIYLKGIFIKSPISIILNRKSRVKIKIYIVCFMSIQCTFSVGLSLLYSIYPIFKINRIIWAHICIDMFVGQVNSCTNKFKLKMSFCNPLFSFDFRNVLRTIYFAIFSVEIGWHVQLTLNKNRNFQKHCYKYCRKITTTEYNTNCVQDISIE